MFLKGRQADVPQEALQVLDIVLRELPTTRYSPVGRSFYSLDLGRRQPLGEGLECWRGFYQSIRPTQMGLSLNIGASSVSGFFAATCSLPFDYVKTQIQKMQPDAQGKYPYTGSLDCAMKTLKAGGPFKFYTGFPVYCVRIAPHVMMTWIFLNQIQKLEKSAGL